MTVFAYGATERKTMMILVLQSQKLRSRSTGRTEETGMMKVIYVDEKLAELSVLVPAIQTWICCVIKCEK